MLYSMILPPDRVVLMARGESGEAVGDFEEQVFPGQTIGKVTYNQLRELGEGEIEVDDDWTSAKAVGREEEELRLPINRA